MTTVYFHEYQITTRRVIHPIKCAGVSRFIQCCCVFVCRFYPYPSRPFHWQRGNCTITPMQVTKSWRMCKLMEPWYWLIWFMETWCHLKRRPSSSMEFRVSGSYKIWWLHKAMDNHGKFHGSTWNSDVLDSGTPWFHKIFNASRWNLVFILPRKDKE